LPNHKKFFKNNSSIKLASFAKSKSIQTNFTKKKPLALNWLHLPNQNQFKQISPNAFNLTRRWEIFMIKKIIIQNLVDLSFEQSYDYNYVPKIYLVSVKLYCQIKVHQHGTFLIYHITSKSKKNQQMVSTLQICQIM